MAPHLGICAALQMKQAVATWIHMPACLPACPAVCAGAERLAHGSSQGAAVEPGTSGWSWKLHLLQRLCMRTADAAEPVDAARLCMLAAHSFRCAFRFLPPATSNAQVVVATIVFGMGVDKATVRPFQPRFSVKSFPFFCYSQVVVATIAFGMGVDKADVRYVIHFTLSKSMEVRSWFGVSEFRSLEVV